MAFRNMKKELVSIIIPIYKVENYLKECIDSVLRQTYNYIEIILVDDGSPDRCPEICDYYSKIDSRIKVLHKKNGGLSDARNKGLDIAIGEWIAFVDSDDFIADNYIEVLYNLAIVNDCQCSAVQPFMFSDGDKIEAPSKFLNEKIEIFNAKGAIEHMFYQTKIDTSAWNKLYHKSLFKTGIRYPDGLLFEDNPTTFRLLALCAQVAVCQQKLYYYRLRKDSIEGSDFTSSKLDQGLHIIKLMESHPEITNQIVNSLHCKQLSLAMHFIVKMPFSYSRRNELWGYVTKYRFKVMLDRKARYKTRFACILSYMGIKFVKTIFVHVSKRN